MAHSCLIVDDAPAVRHAVRHAFQSMRDPRVRVLEAPDVEAARLRLRQKPDVMFLDIRLEDGSAEPFGHEVLDHHPEVAVVLYTSLGREDARVDRLVARGAADHLRKPARPDELTRLYRALVRDRRGVQRVA